MNGLTNDSVLLFLSSIFMKRNTLYNANDANNPELLEQVGEETSKGIELDVAGFILPNWSIVANYAYTHAAITKTVTDSEKDFGMQRPNTPRNAFNIWSNISYRLVRYVTSVLDLVGMLLQNVMDKLEDARILRSTPAMVSLTLPFTIASVTCRYS